MSESLFKSAEDSCGIAPLPKHRIYSISGPDASRYLQGRITQDVVSMKDGDCAQSLVLSPQGKIQGCFHILKNENDFIILSDALSDEEADAFVSALLQFKVADQLELKALNSEHIFLGFIGSSREAILDKAFGLKVANIGTIVPQTEKAKTLDALFDHGAIEVSEKEYELFRIATGIPSFSNELQGAQGPDIPLEDKVSFKKGCYAGQEVIEMAIARGKPNKMLIHFSADTNIEPGSAISVEGKNVGKVTSAHFFESKNTCIGLGFVKTGVEISKLESNATHVSLLASQ